MLKPACNLSATILDPSLDRINNKARSNAAAAPEAVIIFLSVSITCSEEMLLGIGL